MAIRFPIDCPIDCEFHKMWDLSVDDYTHVCTKLDAQMDESDYGFGAFLLCPLSASELRGDTDGSKGCATQE